LLSSGEQVACALIAGRLKHLGYKARSWMSWQIPIITDGPHAASRIREINKKKYQSLLTMEEYLSYLAFKELIRITELQH